MKQLTDLQRVTEQQMCYLLLKYLNYTIYDAGDHDENSPHQWPGNHNVTEAAESETIVTIGLLGDLRFEDRRTSYYGPVTIDTIIKRHLNDMVCPDKLYSIKTDPAYGYRVSFARANEKMTCNYHVDKQSLNDALATAFVTLYAHDVIEVPDVLVS